MKVVFVVGPTASGKSQLALRLAKKFGGAIVNCDSIQLYQGVDIGSAMPSHQERTLVPHFLFASFSPGEELSMGDYYRHFFQVLEEIKNQYPVVFVVGGTGFYFQAIEKGLFEVGPANEKVMQNIEYELTTLGPKKLYEELVEKDPQAAKKISVNDHYRLCRAIEIIRTHGRTKTEVELEFKRQQKPFPFPLLKIGIWASREALEPLVKLRTEKMIKDGLIDEAKSLLSRGFKDWSPLRSIGYQESCDFLEGKIPDLESLQKEIVKNTLRLAKRQKTWFKRDSSVHWYQKDEISQAEELVTNFLI